MAEIFKDAPELLDNTVEVAKRCSLEIRLGASMLPAYPVPAHSNTEDFLREEAARGLRARFMASRSATLVASRGAEPEAPAAAEAARSGYEGRLDLELGVICSMGFAGYFLIVADFIRWARDNGVPVGPGPGPGAGSLVPFVLGLTALDPLHHPLLFQR